MPRARDPLQVPHAYDSTRLISAPTVQVGRALCTSASLCKRCETFVFDVDSVSGCPGAPPDASVFWHAIEQPEKWRALSELDQGEAGRCRAGASRWRKACGQPAVAVLEREGPRGRRAGWFYCAVHLYGRWIREGADGRAPKVFGWRLVPRAEDVTDHADLRLYPRRAGP
ncbi:MAG: hypothetical protein V3S03_03285 [Vicinamibacteria bacterium]